MRLRAVDASELKFRIKLRRGHYSAIKIKKSDKVFLINSITVLDPLFDMYGFWINAGDNTASTNEHFWIGGSGALWNDIESGRVEML